MSTGDLELFQARGKQRRFSPVAAARHSKAARAYMDGHFGESNGYHVQVVYQIPGNSRKTPKKHPFPAKIRIEPIRERQKGEKEKKEFAPKTRHITLDSG